MATGGREDISEMDASVVAGSEAVIIIDHVCQPCSDDGKIREAVGFCVDCADWLCDGCFRVHTIPKPAKHHVLRDLKEMKTSKSLLKSSGKCTEKCDQHSGKRLKYYCPVHDFLGCSLCVIQDHGTCKVDHIPDVCESTDSKNELSTVTAKLEAVAKESLDIRHEVNEKIELVKTNAKETVEAFQSYINRLKDSLDEVGAALEETCKKHGREETTKLKNVVRVCDDIEKGSLNMKTRLENLQNTGQHCNVFVALKQSKGNLATMESQQKDAKCSASVTTYTFKPNVAVAATITGLYGIGTLIEQQTGKNRANMAAKPAITGPGGIGTLKEQQTGKNRANMAAKPAITGPGGIGKLIEQQTGKNRDYSKIQARHVADIPVNSPGNKLCYITGSTLLSPDKLVLTDTTNEEVKLLDTKTHTVISNFKVDGHIWGACKASNDSVIVTDSKNKKLLFLSVNAKGNIFLLKTVPVNGRCKGVAVIDDKMVVTYVNPSKMEIMDTSGTVLQTIIDPQIVHSPQYVAVSPDKKSVYVSNCGNDTVTCVNLDGTLIATYKDDKLRAPEQITIDDNGMIYVAGHTSKNVHLLTPGCKKVKVILDESDGLGNVFAVSYCDQTDRLYIGMNSRNVIKAFQML